MNATTKSRLGRLLLDMAPRLMRLEAHALSGLEVALTHRQYRILQRVEQGVTSPTAISRAASISLAAISESVAAMCRRGLTTRTEDAADRRASQLGLTPDGISALAAAEQALDTLAAEVIDDLPEQALDGLYPVLDSVADSVKRRHARLGTANRR